MNVNNDRRFISVTGLLFMLTGLFCNVWTLAALYSPDGVIASELFRVGIFLSQFMFILWGVISLRLSHKKNLMKLNRNILIGIWTIFIACYMCISVYNFILDKAKWDSVFRVKTDEKVIALTYDDGPNEPRTRKLLEILERNNVKATFFLLGKKVEKNPELITLLIRKGHQIGSHSYTHPSMRFKTPAFIYNEIQKTSILLREIGVTGEIMYRPTFGEVPLLLKYILKQMGVKVVLWDIDPQDWRIPAPEAHNVVSFVDEKTSPGSIILFHDGYDRDDDNIVYITEDIIRLLKAKGYQFKTISELLKYDKK